MRAISLGLTLSTGAWVVASLNAQTIAYQSYGAKAGIPVANAIAFDPNGALVAGTNDGVVRFDGFRFEPVPLPGLSQARIVRITGAPDSSLWIQSDAGDLFHLGGDDRITRVNVPSVLATELAAYRSWQRLRVDTRGHVWINGWGPGLWRFDPATTRWSHVDLPGDERIVDFFFEGPDLLWLASERKVGRVALNSEHGTPPQWSPLPRRILFMRPHSPGRAWIGTDAGVYVRGGDGSMRRALGGEYAAGRHAEPDADASGRLLATAGAILPGQGRRTGVVRLGGDGGVEFPRSAGAAFDELLPRQLLFGREGDFWLAHEGGLIHVDQEYLVSYPVRAPNGPAEFLTGLTGDSVSGSLWISTWGGMYRLRNQRVERMSDLTRRATTQPTAGHDGRHWWREYGDLGFVADAASRAAPTGSSDHLVYETRAGVRFVARPDGMYRMTGQRAARISGRRFVSAYVAEAGDGRIWMAPISSVSTRLDTVEGDSLGTECRACLPSSLRAVLDTLRSLEIVDMGADAFGRVWIAAGRSGLVCIYQTEQGTWESRRLQTSDGLLSDEVHALFPTPDGRLWVGTPRGVQGFRLRPGAPSLDAVLEFRARDGISREFVSAVFEDRDGFLWFGAAPGELHRLDYRHMPRLSSPRVRLTRLEIDGVRQRESNEPLRLRAGNSHLSITLAAQTYRQEERVRVEYRLASSDTSWTILGSGRTIQIASIAPGRHRFEARAVRPGEPPGPVVRQDFVATPLFYRTWWFAIAVIIAFALPPALWYRNRVERRLAIERLRLRIATDLHDDLGSGLTQVSLYSELIRRASEPQVAAWAEQVGDQARSLSEGMRDIIWAIHPQHESWESLESRIKDYAVALLAPRGIRLDMQGTAERTSPPGLSTDVRHNVLLLVKEALHNAVRHAGSRSIEIRWHITTNRLLLTVRDDGAGFEPSRESGGNGLENFRRRAAAIRAELRLDTAPGDGTRVEVDVPLRGRRPSYPSM